MEIRETKEQKSLGIRMFTPVEKLSEVMGAGYGEIASYMEAKGVYPAGPPYCMYYNMDMSNLDVEIGFPIQGEIDGNNKIKVCSVPGGSAATAIHTGPYDTIGTTYDKIIAFVKKKTLQTHSYCYEFYLNDPRETKPEELKTEIFFPIKG